MPALCSTTFVTAGFGRIARAVLARAAAFGCTCAAYDPYVPPAAFRAGGVSQLRREQLFTKPGVLSLHLPLTADTRHFIGSAAIAAFHPGAILVNTSRGGLVDTTALAGALKSGKLAGAGLDVFEEEPLPAGHPLRTAPNAIITSHTAWFSASSGPRLQRMAAEEVVRVLRGEKPRNQLVP